MPEDAAHIYRRTLYIAPGLYRAARTLAVARQQSFAALVTDLLQRELKAEAEKTQVAEAVEL